MWKPVTGYGLLLAGGALGLQWLDYQRLARLYAGDIAVFGVALVFLAIGLIIGARVLAPEAPPVAPGNPVARATLGISPAEQDVLEQLALGLSNKEIARRLGISPNTVKTHVARLLDKLEAARRTEAIRRARELGILP